MKFGHTFQDALRESEFPVEWVQSSISYSQLKKCLKRVEKELAGLGLDAHTLKSLLLDVESQQTTPSPSTSSKDTTVPFQYVFSADKSTPKPKLIFTIDTKSGLPVDVGLSKDTLEWLRGLAQSQTLSNAEAPKEGPSTPNDIKSAPLEDRINAEAASQVYNPDGPVGRRSTSPERGVHTIEIPLTSDSEFFRLLSSELAHLDRLREREQALLTTDITTVGRAISDVSSPSRSRSNTDLVEWREVFDLYLQAKIFFSTNERERGRRTAVASAAQLQWFVNELTRQRLRTRFKLKESFHALDKFLQINGRLLAHLKFQEINHTAMYKILKKFDKHTALNAKTHFPRSLPMLANTPSLAHRMSQAVSFAIAETVLARVPQLTDYLCPVCFSISYRPVRLTCGHVFCIRCMVTMQRGRSRFCPLCRGDVVMAADSANVDTALMNFLKSYFPNEVKVKQKENERAAAVDKWGEDCNKCVVM
ncbi:MAG: hypothetical protein M1833_004691 [Piccolia ochrophora]|nr:MAG: hypothetical protein M1833_004691 [Piccolia ochrophora]